MTNQEDLQSSATSQFSTVSSGRLFLFLFLLGWLALSPVLVGIIMVFLPTTWLTGLLTVGLLVGLLLFPLAGAAWFTRRDRLGFLTLVLGGVGFYMVVEAFIGAVAEPGHTLHTVLRLTLLSGTALGVGGLGLWRAGAPCSALLSVLGLGLPRLSGFLVALPLLPIVTIGWPLAGSLGDSWASADITLDALALALPEELLFRGVILGLFTYHLKERTRLAVLLALLTYLAFTPIIILSRADWSGLVMPLFAIPLALMTTELRARSGSIWPGLLFAWAYQAFPPLFTDLRGELLLITQPWHTAANLWMLTLTGLLALALWSGRTLMTYALGRLAAIAAPLALTVVCSGGWLGLWLTAGYPGFHSDGFLIMMAEQADLGRAAQIEDIIARRAFVREQLIATANDTQAPIRAALDAAGLSYRPFYIINMIQVEGHHARMEEFAGLPGVARVMRNPNVRPYPLQAELPYGETAQVGQGVEWNIHQVQADAVWEIGFTGQGIIVAGQDTGYDWQHPALRKAYRGYNAGSEPNHATNWHDAWHDAEAPFDDGQHGTHTMGTILGDDDAGNQIGMAPGATWIGCRNMRRGIGNPASYAECMEFFLAPYPPHSDPFSTGDVALAPHVINNSWGCPDIEGCDDTVLEPATIALRAAGIMMIVSAGNEGPNCQTVAEPPARYDAVFSVGATEPDGTITGFSSRGPVGSLLKPDIVAPGSEIRSSVPGGGHGEAGGTSMAGPHVAGLVALIWSANPALIGQIDTTEEIIRRSATPVEVPIACAASPPEATSWLEELEPLPNKDACACGDVTGTPNNVYGWGRIDALQAVRLALADY
jgi:hypothetical protein